MEQSLQLQEAVQHVEALGDRLLVVKKQLVDADRQRQATREALTALRKAAAVGGDGTHKSWMQLPAGTFVKLDAQAIMAALQDDAEALEARIKALRVEQKDLTAQLAGLGIRADSAGPGLLRSLLELQDMA